MFDRSLAAVQNNYRSCWCLRSPQGTGGEFAEKLFSDSRLARRNPAGVEPGLFTTRRPEQVRLRRIGAGTSVAFRHEARHQMEDSTRGVCAVPANNIRDLVPAYVNNPGQGITYLLHRLYVAVTPPVTISITIPYLYEHRVTVDGRWIRCSSIRLPARLRLQGSGSNT